MAAAVTTHLQRTEGLKRQAAVVAARIVSVTNETPTVRRFLLRPELQQSAGLLATHDSPAADTGFDFHPGQWLDCFLPGVDVHPSHNSIFMYLIIYIYIIFIFVGLCRWSAAIRYVRTEGSWRRTA
jgi:hypothetical protein